MKNCLRCGRILEYGDIEEGLCIDCQCELDIDYKIEQEEMEHMDEGDMNE